MATTSMNPVRDLDLVRYSSEGPSLWRGWWLYVYAWSLGMLYFFSSLFPFSYLFLSDILRGVDVAVTAMEPRETSTIFLAPN